MLVDEIKRRITAAMKAGNTIEKDILRLAYGEVQTAEARGTSVTDDAVAAIVRKLIKSNEETLTATADARGADARTLRPGITFPSQRSDGTRSAPAAPSVGRAT